MSQENGTYLGNVFLLNWEGESPVYNSTGNVTYVYSTGNLYNIVSGDLESACASLRMQLLSKGVKNFHIYTGIRQGKQWGDTVVDAQNGLYVYDEVGSTPNAVVLKASNPAAWIYYTSLVGGAPPFPSMDTATRYTTEITVSPGENIRAVAILPNMQLVSGVFDKTF